MKTFKVNVMTMRSYILKEHIMNAESEKGLRRYLYSWLANRGYLDKELFYKITIKEII